MYQHKTGTKQQESTKQTLPNDKSPCAVNGLFLHPGLYRAQLSCKIGRDAIEGKLTPPVGVAPSEWAMFNLLHAVEEIATAMMPNDNRNKGET